jgi:hypothetical protein
MTKYERREPAEPVSAVPGLIMPSCEDGQTTGGSVAGFSMSRGAVLLVLLACQACAGKGVPSVMETMPFLYATFTDADQPSFIWLRPRRR